MPITGRPKAPLTVTNDERIVLENWARRRTTAQALALRSRIVLACAQGATNGSVATKLAVTPQTVGKWRARFVERRLDGLNDEPRPGPPRTFSDAVVERLVVKTLEEKPRNATHWSTRSMAEATGMSQTTIVRIWHAFGLQPHRTDAFKLSPDPLFIDKVRDVVGLYMDPPERAVVLCVDEKSQIQALDRSQPVFPMVPGIPERQAWDYIRHGTTSLFAALDVRKGTVIGQLHRRHRAVEFRRFLELIEASVPRDQEVHLVLDNYATHKTPAIQRWLLRHPRFHLHFTPKGASWMNLVERWFGELTMKEIRRGSHRTVVALETAIRSWIEGWNDAPRPFLWTKTADEIFASLSGYLQRINGSGH